MTVNSVTAALFPWHTLKLSWQQRIFDHQSDYLLPTHWKTTSLNSAKPLLISHYKWNIWSLYCQNRSLACSSSSGRLGVKRPIFACFAGILLARKNSRLVSSPASHHGLAKSTISSDFQAVFYSFSFRDNFYLENHNIRRTACFWYDEKNNSDERDTRLKRLSGYSNWDYCCVSAVAQ